MLSSFVATNLDNLLVLVFLLGSSAQRRAAVLLGFLTAVILVVSVAAIGMAVGALIDPALIGYLGIAPIAMGCYLLYPQRGVKLVPWIMIAVGVYVLLYTGTDTLL